MRVRRRLVNGPVLFLLLLALSLAAGAAVFHGNASSGHSLGGQPLSNVVLNGGGELQRCLYAFAVKALLGDDVSIDASLFFPRDGVVLRLDDAHATLEGLKEHLQAARAPLVAGHAVIGPDTGGGWDDLAFAMPANAANAYCKRKRQAADALLGEATRVWEAT